MFEGTEISSIKGTELDTKGNGNSDEVPDPTRPLSWTTQEKSDQQISLKEIRQPREM